MDGFVSDHRPTDPATIAEIKTKDCEVGQRHVIKAPLLRTWPNLTASDILVAKYYSNHE